MRATVTPSPIRKGKRRLLSSCAIAAGIVALAYGGPTLAYAATESVLPVGAAATALAYATKAPGVIAAPAPGPWMTSGCWR